MADFTPGDTVRIKDWDIVGQVVGYHEEYVTVEYSTVVFGEPGKKRLNRFGCLPGELEKIDEVRV